MTAICRALALAALLAVLAAGCGAVAEPEAAYLEARHAEMQAASALWFAGNVSLSADERAADRVVRRLVRAEHTAFPLPYNVNFLQAKPLVDASPLLPLIRRVPKGAALHLHLPSAASYSFLVRNLTYMDGCFVFVPAPVAARAAHLSPGELVRAAAAHPISDQHWRHLLSSDPAIVGRARATPKRDPAPGSLHFFFDDVPSVSSGEWVSLRSLRQAGNASEVDAHLLASLEMRGKDVGSYDGLWSRFELPFMRVGGVLDYAPAFARWMLWVGRTMRADGVARVEMRISSPFWALYDGDGSLLPPLPAVRSAEEQLRKSGLALTMRLICAQSRSLPRDEIQDGIALCAQLHRRYPNVITGYDLQGPEDQGHALLYFLPQLLAANLTFFFHAGETSLPSNNNLYDALLLNTSRIGHGYALWRHPELQEKAKAQHVGIEVCPISNQILKLVKDIRQHAALSFLSNGLGVTISSDDPGLYTYSGVSYDWFAAAAAWDLDLASLKKLAMNSIEYAAFEHEAERSAAAQQWQSEWNDFVQWVLEEYPEPPRDEL